MHDLFRIGCSFIYRAAFLYVKLMWSTGESQQSNLDRIIIIVRVYDFKSFTSLTLFHNH